ncbi:MAG: PKD domain-containing protein [Thermoleophilaceae bacterium]
MTSPTRTQSRPWRRCLAAVLVVLACPAAALARDQRPDASFSFSPEDPRAGHTVRFESSSCDPDGRLTSQAWDLDGDGAYDDAEGRVIAHTFGGSGTRTVGLRVTARGGKTDTRRRRIVVDTVYALPRPDSERLMSPFPVVRIAGRLTRKGARVRLLAIRAPVCSRVEVSCRGRSCPVKRASAYAGRKRLRFRRFQRRLRAGTVLTVRVSKNDLIGKFTRFRIRKGREPKRRDRCLRPGERGGSRCPRD